MKKFDNSKNIGSFFKCFLLLIAVVNLCFFTIDSTAGYITDKSATCVNTFVAEEVPPTTKPDTDTDNNHDNDFQEDDSTLSPPTGKYTYSYLMIVLVVITSAIALLCICADKKKFLEKRRKNHGEQKD